MTAIPTEQMVICIEACERLAGRCRITGLRYTVSSSGAVNAGLSVSIAAPLARSFGREGIKTAQAAGATLTGAEITGTDAAPDQAAATTARTAADTTRARLARELARTDLSSRERAELRRQQSAAEDQARAARASASEVKARLADTPLVFFYETGRGNGLVDRIRDAGDTAVSSIGVTLTAALWILAALGPPLVVLAVLYLAWRRWGRHWWAALLYRTDRT